ncbi:MAG: hypothetical protein RL685_80 [Pseudomonadota bacterium]|jgi:uncharacterized delta-60 repeat protein
MTSSGTQANFVDEAIAESRIPWLPKGRSSNQRRTLRLAALCLVGYACSSNRDPDGGGHPDEVGASVVGVAGGTVSNPDGAKVVIPPGALATDISGGIDQVPHLLLQPDGSLVVSVDIDEAGLGPDRTGVARYHADGTLDDSFGMGGKLILTAPQLAGGLALQADGKLILVGSAVVEGSAVSTDLAVMRLRVDGSPDPGFGSEGVVKTRFSTLNPQARARAVTLQPDGKIVVAGSEGLINSNFAAARYHPDGTLDTSFGVGGTLAIDFVYLDDSAGSVALQPDGKIVLGGEGGERRGYALARVLP